MTKPTRPPPVSIRFTEADRQRIVRDAADAGLSVGAYIRARCLKARASAVDLVEMKQCMAELGRLSYVLGQLLRIAAVGEAPAYAEMKQSAEELCGLFRQLMMALGKKP